MTFNDLKTELLSRAKVLELCPAYHDASIAANRPQLLEAAKDLFVWTYQSGVVDDTLLDEFTDAELNAYNIYKAGVSLVDPSADVIYLMKTGTTSLTLTGDNKLQIRMCGATILDATLSGNSYLDVKGYDNSSITIALTDAAVLVMEAVQVCDARIEAGGNSACQIIASDKATIEYSGADNSHAIIKGYNHSTLNVATSGTATADVKTYNQSQYNPSV